MRSLPGFLLMAALTLVAVPALADVGRSSTADLGIAAPAADPSQIISLLTFSPRTGNTSFAEVSRRLPALRDLGERHRFLVARLQDFHNMVEHYDMHPNDVATARAFAIVAGYRAYNGARLRDEVSGRILLATVALQIASAQQGDPWSDARKQAMYDSLGGEAAALNWAFERAETQHDVAMLDTVHAWARSLLSRQLGRDPEGVSPDTFPCLGYPNAPCDAVIQNLRTAFQPDDLSLESEAEIPSLP